MFLSVNLYSKLSWTDTIGQLNNRRNSVRFACTLSILVKITFFKVCLTV